MATALRVGLILLRPLPHDVESAIMAGLRRIRTVLKGEARVEGNAPYGIIWYGMNLPIARLVQYDGRRWMISLAILDTLFLWLSQSIAVQVFVAYLFIGTFQLLRAPWNVTIDWIILLSPISWIFLILAPISKLPLGLPLHAFGDTGRGIFYQHNYIYYGLLGTLWLIIFSQIFALGMRDFFIEAFGFCWAVLLGFLYIRKRTNSRG